jgi:hypothetical protein
VHPPTTLQLYFQQLWPLGRCAAEDGRVTGYLLAELVRSQPKELAHAIRTFANRMAMLRECGFGHIGAMLAALFATNAQSEAEHVTPSVQSLASVTEAEATAIGRMLASIVHQAEAPEAALHMAFTSNRILGTMNAQYTWFLPMLHVLIRQRTTLRRSSIIPIAARHFSSAVAPEETEVTLFEGVLPIEDIDTGFDSVVGFVAAF